MPKNRRETRGATPATPQSITLAGGGAKERDKASAAHTKKKGVGFCYLPAEIVAALPILGNNAVRAAVALGECINRDRNYWEVKVQDLASLAGRSKRQIFRGLAELEAKGLLKITPRGQHFASGYSWTKRSEVTPVSSLESGVTDLTSRGDKTGAPEVSPASRITTLTTLTTPVGSAPSEPGSSRTLKGKGQRPDQGLAPNPYAQLAPLLRREQLNERDISRVLAMAKRLNGDPVQVLGAVLQAREQRAEDIPAFAATLLRRHGVSDQWQHAAKVAITPEPAEPTSHLAHALDGIGRGAAGAGSEPKKER